MVLGSPLLMENGTFSWDGQEEILSAINMRVEKGELVAVVGNVGSGNKSYDFNNLHSLLMNLFEQAKVHFCLHSLEK